MPDPAPKTRRINRGRGHSYLLDGEQADGVTWILSNGIPKPALIGWAANTTAGYAIDHWDELTELKVLQSASASSRKPGSATTTPRWCAAPRSTPSRNNSPAARKSTSPNTSSGTSTPTSQFARDWQPEEVIVESIVGNRRWRYMGTLDLVARSQRRAAMAARLQDDRVGDLARVSALQLAGYRHADFYIDDTRREQPMPSVDQAGCIWLRADGYDLVPVDAGAETFKQLPVLRSRSRGSPAQPRER